MLYPGSWAVVIMVVMSLVAAIAAESRTAGRWYSLLLSL